MQDHSDRRIDLLEDHDEYCECGECKEYFNCVNCGKTVSYGKGSVCSSGVSAICAVELEGVN